MLFIRPAQAVDAKAMAPLVYSSGPAVCDYVFTSRWANIDGLPFLERALRHEPGEFGYGVHLVGERDGRVVAAGAGFDGADFAAMTTYHLRYLLAVYGPIAFPPFLVRGFRVEKALPPPMRDEWAITHVGVAPNQRSRGFGQALVEALLAKGKSRGLKTAVLDVSVENPRAEALYARMVFQVTGERTSRLKNRHGFVATHRRMELKM